MLNIQEPASIDLTDDDINQIKSFGNPRRFKKKATIFFQDDDSDAFYFIDQGQVKVQVLSQSGRINLLRILGPGEYFGELGLLDAKPRSTTVETLVDTQLTIISKTQFLACLMNNAMLSNKFIPVLTERIRSLTNELTVSRVNNAYFCLRTKLYDLASKQSDGTYLIEQKFTQQELGEFVGTARENINRFIKGLKQGGYIKENTQGQWIIVKPLPQNW
jgi:CRP/FNR family cyclic AMP-dependent transcriptional regulator